MASSRAAAQLWRLRVLGRDGWRVLKALGRTVQTVLAPSRPRPSLAALAGEPTARVGAPSIYELRLHNPTEHPCHLRVIVRGRGLRGDRARFAAHASLSLDPGASVDRRVQTTWEGDATFVDATGATPTLAGLPTAEAEEAPDRWVVEAVLTDSGRELERLVIGGVFVGSPVVAPTPFC